MCNLRSRLFFHWNLLIKRLVNRVFVLVNGIIFNRSNELMINPIQNGPLWSCSQVKGGGGGEKVPPSLKSVTHILQWWNLVVIPYLKKIQKMYESRDTPIESCWHQHFFDIVSIKIIIILMMSANLATLCLLNIKVFWNKGYNVIVSVHDVTNKFLSLDSNYVVDVVM